MTVQAISTLGIAGIAVVAIAVLILLISVLHPEGMRRPGGYLDGEEPRRADEEPPPG